MNGKIQLKGEKRVKFHWGKIANAEDNPGIGKAKESDPAEKCRKLEEGSGPAQKR